MRWLADVCLKEARRTKSHHDDLRAGVFIALAGMRSLLGNAGPHLLEWELAELEKLNSLYHDCLHGSFTSSAYFYPYRVLITSGFYPEGLRFLVQLAGFRTGARSHRGETNFVEAEAKGASELRRS